jgi:hypothetical protein
MKIQQNVKSFAALAASILVIGCSENSPVTPNGPDAAGAAAFAPASQMPEKNILGVSSTRLIGRLVARLKDPLASGSAVWELRNARMKFSVEVEDVSTAGKHLVRVNGGLVGSIEVKSGIGGLNLEGGPGRGIPVMVTGDKVEVFNPAGVLILTGTVH